MIVEWDPGRPKKKATEMIKSILQDGGIIGYPTDTFYGLGCDLFNIKAIRKLYLIKRLPTKWALSIICRDLKDVSEYAIMDDFAFGIMKQCLPGPYTFVLKAKKIMPKLLMTEKKEVGIRIPSHPVPVALAGLIERPIINTSAKISGGEVLTDPRKIEEMFKGSLDLVVDGGIMVSDASTVLRIADDAIEVLRKGKGPIKHLL
jgi:tRNA threonylcarbamoyl adenosine modification protein (Sua5/YciO/YrdC/YwlC family)